MYVSIGKTSKRMRKTRVNEEIYNIYQKSENKELISFSLCGTTFPDKSYKITRKKSRIACIEYVEEGAGIIHLDKRCFTAKAGDSYFLMSGMDQHYYSDPKDPWKKYFINLSGRLFESLVEGYGLYDTAHFEGLDLSAELKSIIELIKRDSEDHTDALVVIVNRIFLKMRESIAQKRERKGAAEDIKDYIDARVGERIGMSELSSLIKRSESQTIRIFKNAYGITPYAYLIEKKISLAKKLLTGTNLTVKEISEKLAFSDEYYFSNLFKQKVGTSPSSFRRE